MITDRPLVWVLTLVLVLAGVYFLARCVAPRTVAAPGGFLDRTAGLWHATMAADMVLMLWPVGVRAPRWPQLIVFGTGALYFFLVGCAWPGADRGRYRSVLHGAMMLAMVWMVAVMPTSTDAGAGASTSMAGMPGMTMPGAAPGGHHTWLVLASGVAVALLLVAHTVDSTARGINLARIATPPAVRTALLRTPTAEAAGHALMGLAMIVMTLGML